MFKNSRFTGGKSGKDKAAKGGDPDYEEVGPQRQNRANHNVHRKENVSGVHCDLCGAVDAAVHCEACSQQAFCQACDETYHGHPRRATHTRKVLISRGSHVKPPLPPKGSEGQIVVSPPQPPPRKNKKGGILSSAFGKRENENDTDRSLIGNLKKIMGNRPLPPPPNQIIDRRRNSTPDAKTAMNVTRSSPALNSESPPQAMAIALPQSIIEINSKAGERKPPSSMPQTPASAHAQYPKIQPKLQPAPCRKLSLQQLPPTFDDKRASMIDNNQPTNNTWDRQQPPPNQKLRSQSVSDDKWNQMIVVQGHPQTPGTLGYHGTSTAASEVGGVAQVRRGYNTIGTSVRPMGRGMVSSASVCDLNSLAHHQLQQQQQQQQQHNHGYPNMHPANSFQQLSVMSYDPNMIWVQPAPCSLCQPPTIFTQPIGSGGMKRTASNISMNLSSLSSDVAGYPWSGTPHIHQHMPMGYPGYYPGCHQHMVPSNFTQGSAMSIPDSMRSYNRMPSSPAPSARSSSQRSHKSSKSRSFSATDGRRSRNQSRKRSEDLSESDSPSSSISDDDENHCGTIPSSTKPSRPVGLAWQCDHCTFINPGHVQACGMCSKVPGKNRNRRASDRRKDKRKEKKESDSIQNLSDYDNDHRRRDTRLKSSSSAKSSSGKNRKKPNRRECSPRSSSASESEAEDSKKQLEGKLEKQLRDLRVSASRTKEKDRGKKEGKRAYNRRV